MQMHKKADDHEPIFVAHVVNLPVSREDIIYSDIMKRQDIKKSTRTRFKMANSEILQKYISQLLIH